MTKPTPKRRFQSWEYNTTVARQVIISTAVVKIEHDGNVRIHNMIACMKEYRTAIEQKRQKLPRLYPCKMAIDAAWILLLADSAVRMEQRVMSSLTRGANDA